MSATSRQPSSKILFHWRKLHFLESVCWTSFMCQALFLTEKIKYLISFLLLINSLNAIRIAEINKIENTKYLMKMCHNWYFHTLLMGTWNSITTLKNCLSFSYKFIRNVFTQFIFTQLPFNLIFSYLSKKCGDFIYV